MSPWRIGRALLACACLPTAGLLPAIVAFAGQVPGPVTAPEIPITHRDRVYAAEQFSNTVSVTDAADNTLLGVIRLGEPSPGNFSPLYRGQLLVHGLGFSPDHRTLAAVSIGSNSVTFIDTGSNAIKHTTYVGRSPHEAFFTPDGAEVWVTIRGEDYISVIDPNTYTERTRITSHASIVCTRCGVTTSAASSRRRDMTQRKPNSPYTTPDAPTTP